MTQEEKAKAYDEAIETARKELKQDLHESGVSAIQRIFPELKESEDERIRKEIIDYLNGKLAPGEELIKKWIAYLEKQKEQNLEDIEDEAVRKYMKLDRFALANMLAERDKTNTEAIEAFENIEKQPAVWSEEDERIRKAIFKALSKKDARDILLAEQIEISDALSWLEKQKDEAQRQFNLGMQAGREEVMYEVEKEQKPAPKFNVGDKVEYRGDIYEITDVEIRNNVSFYSVCVINTPIDGEEVKTGIGPGGEKDMVKVEQKPAEWSEEDKEKFIIDYLVSLGYPIDANGNIPNYNETFESCKSALTYWLQQNLQKMLANKRIEPEGIRTETLLKDSYIQAYGEGIEDSIRMLSSQCENSSPQPKQEWSEEDEKFFKTALWHISYSVSNGKRTDEHCDTTDWLKGVKERLKSLRPQPQWKPSDRQLGALLTALGDEKKAGSDVSTGLKSLYYDLKNHFSL